MLRESGARKVANAELCNCGGVFTRHTACKQLLMMADTHDGMMAWLHTLFRWSRHHGVPPVDSQSGQASGMG